MTVTPDVRLPCENTWRVTLVFLTNKRPKEKSHVESYLFSQQNFSTARTLNLLLETRSVKRLKMNKHTLHSTRVTACPASSGQTAFRSCSQRVFCSSISRIKRTSARRRASRPLARRCWRDSSGGSRDATGTGEPRGQRPGLSPPHLLPLPIRPWCWGEARQEGGRQEYKIGKGNWRAGKWNTSCAATHFPPEKAHPSRRHKLIRVGCKTETSASTWNLTGDIECPFIWKYGFSLVWKCIFL